MKTRHTPLITLLLLPVLLLCACTTTPPVTKARAQHEFDITFAKLRATISTQDTLNIKNHDGRVFLPGSCTNHMAEYSDTSAIYVPKTFDQNTYLKKLQTKLNTDGYKTSLGITGGYNTLLIGAADNYTYQAIATTKVKNPAVDTNKAILFVATSPCMKTGA